MIADSLWTNTELGIKANVEKCGLGLSYGGSKRKLSVDIFNTMLDDCAIDKPFVYDIFGGGGALTYQAAFCGLNVLYNDLNTGLYNLLSNIKSFENSGFEDYFLNNFVNDKDFKRLRDAENKSASVVALLNIYSYGGVLSYYTYNKLDVVTKKAGHYMIGNNNYNSAEILSAFYKGRIGTKGTIYNYILDLHDYFKDIKEWKDRYLIYNNFIKKIEALTALQDFEFVKKWDIKKIVETDNKDFLDYINKKYELNLTSLSGVDGYTSIAYMKHFPVYECIKDISTFDGLDKISYSNLDFKEVEIKHSPSECVILCDIPYKSVGHRLYKENLDKGEFFDFGGFYEWIRGYAKKGYKVYICEYSMPDDFKEIMAKDYASRFGELGYKKVVERLYTL